VILLACAAPAAQPAAAAQPPAAPSRAASRIDAICALPLFRHLSYREQVAVLSVARARTFEPGSTIVKQGEMGSEMFLIIEGKLVVERDGIKIAELGPGGHFGEMSLVDDARRSATVKVVTRTEVLSIGQAEINGLMRAEPVLAVKVLWDFVQVLSTRLRAASAEIIELQIGQPPQSSIAPPFRVS
jgi:CRP-like cAMP-binding protein